MALFLSGVDIHGREVIDLEWHVGEPLPQMAMVDSLQADGDELFVIDSTWPVRVMKLDDAQAASVYAKLLKG